MPDVCSYQDDDKTKQEHELLCLLRQRDPETQRRVYQTHADPLRWIARGILANQNEADSLVNEIFGDFFFRYVDTLYHPQAIWAYLRLMTIRRARRQREKEQRLVLVANVDDSPYLSSTTWRPEVQIDRATQLRALTARLPTIKEQNQRLLKLHYADGLTYSEIGAQIGQSRQAVGKKIIKTIKLLSKQLPQCHSGFQPAPN